MSTPKEVIDGLKARLQTLKAQQKNQRDHRPSLAEEIASWRRRRKQSRSRERNWLLWKRFQWLVFRSLLRTQRWGFQCRRNCRSLRCAQRTRAQFQTSKRRDRVRSF